MTFRTFRLLSLLLLIVMVAASCKSVSYMSRSIDIERENARQETLGAELKVDLNNKVTAASDMQDTKKDAVIHAYYNCISNNNIDVVVDPIVKITRFSVFATAASKKAANAKWWKVQYHAEINGYGGKYVKLETDLDKIKKFDNIDMNSVVKFKLMTDPDFYKSYYNKQKTNNVIINPKQESTGSTATISDKSQGFSLPSLKPAPVSPLGYSDLLHKGTVTRNAGIALTTIGVALMIPVALPVMFCTYYTDWVGYWVLEPIGAGFTAAGIGCLAAGMVQIKKAKKANVSVSYGLAPNGAQLALKF